MVRSSVIIIVLATLLLSGCEDYQRPPEAIPDTPDTEVEEKQQ